ncbi:VWA domain-containing protein, partial [Bacillus sp. S20C3]|nr:VWA domain-containing protein [Bacillus sp. S20C3]
MEEKRADGDDRMATIDLQKKSVKIVLEKKQLTR